jgi:phospholipid transport system substrate-binding protein
MTGLIPRQRINLTAVLVQCFAVMALTLAGLSSTVATAEARDPARAFMQRAANELIDAQRKGTPDAFARVIRKYGHVPAIGMDALGSYRAGLNPEKRRKYYNGLVKFISRYAANEGRKYPVVRAEFPSPAVRDGRHVLVDSVIHLSGGSTYNVRWMLVPRGRKFYVRDAQVLSFWSTPFLTRLFEDYIRQNGGRVDALVVALNQ